jgi:hypothetical protein
MTLLIVIIWFVVSIFVGIAASSRGRSAFGWFLISLLLSPVLALLFLLVFPPLSDGPTRHLDDAELQKNIRRNRSEPTF